MNKNYRLLILSLICGLMWCNTGFANKVAAHDRSISALNNLALLSETPAARLYLNQQIKLGDFTMQITDLQAAAGHAAKGRGEVYVPFLDEKMAVQFEDISVNVLGGLMAGEIITVNAQVNRPTFRSPESEVLKYLTLSKEKGHLPRLLTPSLEANGMDLGGHEMILTNLVFTKESTLYDALFLVQNLDGRVTTFSRKNIPLSSGEMSLCSQVFSLDEGDQTITDPILPIIIKGFNPNAAPGTVDEGTFVSFTCDGFESFQLAGEYHFDNKKVKLLAPRDGAAADAYLLDTLVAKFSTNISTWGQFTAAVDFGEAPFNEFEIVGVDDVIFTIDSAMIDYSDTQNPSDLPLSYFEDSRNKVVYNNNYLDWRGFFIKSVSVQLPQSLAITQNNSRVKLAAKNIIFDRPNGLTAGFTALPAQNQQHIAEGNLEGWGITLDTVQIQVTHNSPEKFDILGDVQIPVIKEGIAYKAKFDFPDKSTQGNNAKVALAFELLIADSTVFTVPFLKDASLVMANSVAGFQYIGGVYTPYANFSGELDLGFTSGSDIAADFNFAGLGFQGLTLNYDYINQQVIPQPPSSGGLGNINFYAFEFGGKTFVNNESGPDGEPAGEDPDGNTPSNQKVKGFPIAVKNIGFRSTGEENDKSLDFTIALNFTKPKVGLTASASLGIVSQINFSKLVSSEPWSAFSFKTLKLYEILIGSKAKPVDIGGVSLYGGLAVIDKHVTYGDGFKGFLVMSVKPGITVDVVGQFGTISKQSGALDYRYWFADAKMTLKNGIKLGPAPVGVFGFGGGAYYNMTQLSFAATQLDVSADSGSQNIPEDGSTPQISSALLQPGVGLFCSYAPQKDVFGVKAVVVLGTHPKPKTANMDLILGIEFNTDPFGLRKVSLQGDVYFMADLNKRQKAQVKGTTIIVYDHTAQMLTIDGSVSVKLVNDIITGGGNFNLFFNLKPGQSDDWYVALGAPPIAKRMGLKFKLGTTQSIASYFVAGNVSRLPVDKRQLPLLREYHPMLQQFEGQNTLDFTQLMNGNAILMGMSYTYKVEKDYKVIGASVNFTAGYDAMLSECNCSGYDPTGVDGWYLQGRIFGAMEGKLDIRVKLPFHKGRYNIASLKAGALVEAKLPSPTWMSAHVAGSYSILKGLVKGKFNLDLEYGEKCQEVGTNLSAEDLLANIKIIGAINPLNNAENIQVYREKLVITSFIEPINQVMDFSAESDDGLKVLPFLKSVSITGPQPVQGYWRYLNAANVDVGPTGIYNRIEFISTKLLQQLSYYNFTIKVGWKKKTKNDSNWKEVWETDDNDNKIRLLEEIGTSRFKTDSRPTTLPPEAVLASYPEYRAVNYHIFENPTGGGVALRQQGWGYLFNPKKRDNQDLRPCDPRVLEYNYVVKVWDVAAGLEVFKGALTAVPVPEWGKPVGDPVFVRQQPCQSDNPFLNWLYRYFNIPCEIVTQGPCTVLQPTQSTAQSNVKYLPSSWNFGGAQNNFDLAVSQNASQYDKAIGFPNFSQSLQKGKVYRFEIVAEPIVAAETYAIQTNQINEPTVSTEVGEYTISKTTQSISGQFSGSAPDKIIYASTFGTSMYNTFSDKLAAINTPSSSSNAFHLTADHSWLFNNYLDFYQDASYYTQVTHTPSAKNYVNRLMQQATIDYTKKIADQVVTRTGYPINEYVSASQYNQLISTIQSYPTYSYYYWYIATYGSYRYWAIGTGYKNVVMDMSTKQYRLNGNGEGFDQYEISRFSYYSTYDWESGFVKYMIDVHPKLRNYFKWGSYSFGDPIIPNGPFVFYDDGTGSKGLLAQGAITKSAASNIALSFYPRTSTIYRLMRQYYTYLSLVFYYEYNPYLYTYNTLLTDLDNVSRYDNLSTNYGPLFRLKYSKAGRTVNINLNK